MADILVKIMKLARTKLGQKYVLGSRAPMANPKWDGPWDCAEFVSWCVYQATGRLYGTKPQGNPMMADAYTGYWWEQSRDDGSQVSVGAAIALNGGILLRKPQPGRVGHIAFSDGRGGTVEAHSSARGVCEGSAQNRAWDTGVILPWLATGLVLPEADYEPPARRIRVTSPLTNGSDVRKIQLRLTELGFYPGRADGVYGPQTAHAVTQFQVAKKLNPDGEVGDITWKALKLR